MERKVCIVTGANAGIGLETARGLATQGAVVVMVCRNEERGNVAVEDIKASTGNSQIHLLLADLSSQSQIRELARTFQSQFERLDILVNNAGVFLPKYQATEDGIEATFAINHLAYFLLTHLLLDTLHATSSSRIVNVSSNAHRSGRIHFSSIDSEQNTGSSKFYNGYVAYAQSKLANVLFTYELAKRLGDSHVTCNALHPGVVATNIANHGMSFFSVFFRLFKPFFLSPTSGAETSLYVATSSDIEGVTGKYYDNQTESRSSQISYDEELSQNLWTLSCALTGLEEQDTLLPT